METDHESEDLATATIVTLLVRLINCSLVLQEIISQMQQVKCTTLKKQKL